MSSQVKNQPAPLLRISGYRHIIRDQTLRIFPPDNPQPELNESADNLEFLGRGLNLPDLAGQIKAHPNLCRYLTLGAWRRTQTQEATQSFLTSIWSDLRGAATRRKFVRLFRPQGEWLTDSFAFARQYFQRAGAPASLQSFNQALQETLGEFPMGGTPLSGQEPPWETLVFFGYNLYQLRTRERSRYLQLLNRLRSIDNSLPDLVKKLCDGLRRAEKWYSRVIFFFLFEKWLVLPQGRQASLFDLVQDFWGPLVAIPDFKLDVIPMGYPDASFAEESEKEVLAAVIAGENDQGREFLARLSLDERRALLIGLPLRLGVQVIDNDTTKEFLSWKSLFHRGLINRGRKLLFDPGNALGNLPELIVHELHHLILSQLKPLLIPRRHRTSTTWSREVDSMVEEGFAELFTAEILAPIFHKFPLTRFFQLLRLHSLAALDADDPHVTGYLALKAIYQALGKSPETLVLFLKKKGFRLDQLLTHPEVRRALEKSPGRFEKGSLKAHVWVEAPEILIEIGEKILIREVKL